MPKSVSPQDGFDSPLTAAVTERDKNTMQMVRAAIRNKHVMLAYQPIVQATQAARPAFYEGLLRVMDHTGRIIPAREFIEVAEETETGRELDCLAIDIGLQALADYPDIRLSLNMSARSIGHPRWTQSLKRGLSRHPTIAERLILEITESSAMTMPGVVRQFMSDLQALGISFALDDFGAGHTAFKYFKDFCFDVVKIDGAFIRGIAHDPDNQCLTQALVSIAQHFDMFTVAEFVETAEDAAYLQQIGVDCLQGHFYGAASINPAWLDKGQQQIAV